MRISSDPKDPDFYRCTFERNVTVHLDGAERKYVLEADDEAGYVIHHERGADGEMIRNGLGESLMKVRSEGHVEFIGTRRAQRLVNAN